MLDPDSPIMGNLVDGWLRALRLEGYSTKELQHMASRLGKIVGAVGLNPHKDATGIIGRFLEWVHTQPRTTT